MPKANTDQAFSGAALSAEQVKRVSSSMSILSRAFTLSRPHEKMLEDAGVRLDRAGSALLFKLRHLGESTRVSDLAEKLDVDTPAVTRKLQQLARLGYVNVTPDPEDKRAKLITLTPAGEEVTDRVMVAVKHRFARLFDGWSAQEISEFSTSLDKFAQAITKEMETDRDG